MFGNKEARAILGVPPDADVRDIKKAFAEAAKLQHPDHGGDARKFNQAREARDILLREARRRSVRPIPYVVPRTEIPYVHGRGTLRAMEAHGVSTVKTATHFDIGGTYRLAA